MEVKSWNQSCGISRENRNARVILIPCLYDFMQGPYDFMQDLPGCCVCVSAVVIADPRAFNLCLRNFHMRDLKFNLTNSPP